MNDFEEFLVLGDFHLDKPKPYPDYLQVAKKAVLSCLDYAEENGIKNIVILGDLFDTPYPSDSAKIALLEIFDRSFEFFVILGNHDWASTEKNSLELLSYLADRKYSNVHMFVTPTLSKIGKLRCQFLPFPQELPISDKQSICFSHAAYNGFMTDSHKKISGTEIDKRHKWYVGHIHLRQGDIYPGSILQNTFGETEEKFFFHIIATSQSNIKTKAVPILQPYHLRKAVIYEESDFSKLEADKSIYYKLDVKNDVVIPRGLEEKYNIVNIGYFRKDEELDVSSELVLSKEEMEICNPTLYLSSYLKSKGIKKSERLRAKKLVQSIMKGIKQ